VPRFIGVDGEAWNEDGEHRYVLLAASCGQWAFDPNGLSTYRCFEFLLNLPKKAVKVGFGWNYDINMMLRDLPLDKLVRLWKEGFVRWDTYYLEWIPGKTFLVKGGGRSCKVYDVFGFFQTSFVKALKKWNFPVPPDMEAMKQSRSQFDSAMKQAIIEYCLDECRSLVDLMDALEIALTEVDLHVSNWVGAGAIASSLMKKHGVKEHHEYESAWPELEIPILTAYFGGRVELFQAGEFPRLWDYDISSAYPSIALELPSLSEGEWQWEDHYDPSLQYVIWDCQWHLDNSLLCPFPVRRKGSIYYPRNGSGWYHSAEVKAAQKLTGNRIIVSGGWRFKPASNELPFSFITKTYNDRVDLKREKHAGEKCLKLGLNSIYGKLAQGVGYQGSAPLFQSFFWAGMITAGTRARVLEVAMTDIDSLVMIATDGIFFKSDPQVPISDGLGGLELTEYVDAFVAQPGVYQATDSEGEVFGKSRGFFTKEINFDDLRDGYKKYGTDYVGEYESERFCGFGFALTSHNIDIWRTWNRSTRKLSLTPNRKFVEFGQAHLVPPTFSDPLPSEVYTPKAGFATMTESEVQGILEYLQGTDQPMKDY
jgi:hypothetical protein